MDGARREKEEGGGEGGRREGRGRREGGRRVGVGRRKVNTHTTLTLKGGTHTHI